MLEGIALVGNDEFAIIDEAYPYIAQRLLTDDSPRLRESLKYMIYGKSHVFDAERLIDMLSAFETFTVNSRSSLGDSSSPPPASLPPALEAEAEGFQLPALPFPLPFPLPPAGAGAGTAPAPGLAGAFAMLGLPERMFSGALASSRGASAAAAPPAASWQTIGADPNNTGSRAALLFLLSDEGRFFRTFLMDEIVRSIDAMSRDQLARLVKRLGLGGVVVPVFLPLAKRSSIALAPDVDEGDKMQVESVAKLVEFFAGGSVQRAMGGGGGGGSLLPLMPRVAQQIVPEVTLRLVSRISARFIRTFYM